MVGYWFSEADGHTANTRAAGLPPAAIGVEHEHTGQCIPCKSGLHWSPTPYEALRYAAGTYLWRVEGNADAVPHDGDKFCGRVRRFIGGPVDVGRFTTDADWTKAHAGWRKARADWTKALAALTKAHTALTKAEAALTKAEAAVTVAYATWTAEHVAWLQARAAYFNANAAWATAYAALDAERFNAACRAALDIEEERITP